MYNLNNVIVTITNANGWKGSWSSINKFSRLFGAWPDGNRYKVAHCFYHIYIIFRFNVWNVWNTLDNSRFRLFWSDFVDTKEIFAKNDAFVDQDIFQVPDLLNLSCWNWCLRVLIISWKNGTRSWNVYKLFKLINSNNRPKRKTIERLIKKVEWTYWLYNVPVPVK